METEHKSSLDLLPESLEEKTLAKILGVQTDTLLYWRRQGLVTPSFLPAVRKNPTVVYSREQIAKAAWIAGLRKSGMLLSDIREEATRAGYLDSDSSLIRQFFPLPPEK